MRYFRSLLVLCLSAVLSTVNAISSTGSSVLVIIEPAEQEKYSIFFGGLEEQGYDLTFRAPKADSPALMDGDSPAFKHVIILASETKSFAKDITPQSLVQLVSSNTNLLIALSTKQTPLSSLATEFSLILPPPGTPLVSYFPDREEPITVVPVPIPHAHIPHEAKHTQHQHDQKTILTPNLSPIWFSGVPHAFAAASSAIPNGAVNPLLVPILRAPSESFASESDAPNDVVVDAAERGGEGLWAGSNLGLVTGFQATNGARVTWAGGKEVFGDEFARKPISDGVPSGNAQFVRDISAWTFQESHVLRIDKTTHHLVNATSPSEQYTTNDHIVFEAYISIYDPPTNSWSPYSGITDLQLEFTMLDPHIRTALLPDLNVPGKYSVTFRAPDRHGVFKFVIDWKRKGWTYLESSTTVAVVPPRHDGYPRFISAAWPYYVGAISTSVAFFLFSTLWLAGSDAGARVAGSKGPKDE